MRRIAVIPARGGSKRLPRKNIVPFMGKPIMGWTIEAALESGVFDKVVVSTEDAEIAGVGSDFGAEVMDRSTELASDTARAAEVCLDVLDREQYQGREYDIMCCLFPTAPLRGASDIAAVVGLVEPGVADFAMAVTEFQYPAWQALRQEKNGLLRPLFPDLMDKNSQEMGTLLVDNGSTYAIAVPAFREVRSLNGPSIRGHAMSRETSVDIDVAEDLEMASFYAKKIMGAE